jgi:hypothetical protein
MIHVEPRVSTLIILLVALSLQSFSLVPQVVRDMIHIKYPVVE